MTTTKPLFSTFTHSVGANAAGHTLTAKLRAIVRAGYDAVEIFQDDLDAFASSAEFQAIYEASTPPESPTYAHRSLQKSGADDRGEDMVTAAHKPSTEAKTAWNAHGPCTPTEVAREMAAASYIAGLCSVLGLKVLTLQPLRDYEGWVDEADRHAAMMRATSRFPVMRALGTDLMVVCSNNVGAPKTTGDPAKLALDLAALADEAARYDAASPYYRTQPIRIAYEALSWGAHVDVWRQAYRVVELADRRNVGICFDSFNTLGREYADPCSPSGIQQPEDAALARVEASIRDIARTVRGDKVFFLQVGDARKLPSPLAPSPNADEPRPARMIWSRGNRLYPGELDRGGFMPVTHFVRAVLQTGYKGPWSIEVFNSSLNDEGDTVVDEHARRGHAGLSWLAKQVL